MNEPTILVVDNDPAICDLIEEFLTDEGYQVVCVSQSMAALTALVQRQITPDLILIDMTMPQLSGSTFRAQQQADPALAAIPVVLMSAVHAWEIAASNDFGDVVLHKPFELDTLLTTVERVLEHTDGQAGAVHG